MRRRLTTLVIAVAMLGPAATSWAQQASTSTTAPPLIVRLSVLAAPGVPATVALRNGEMGRWTKSDETQYGLTVVVADGVATMYVFHIMPGESPETERIKQIAKRRLVQADSVAVPKADPLFTVTLLETGPVPSK